MNSDPPDVTKSRTRATSRGPTSPGQFTTRSCSGRSSTCEPTDRADRGEGHLERAQHLLDVVVDAAHDHEVGCLDVGLEGLGVEGLLAGDAVPGDPGAGL